jgi:O-antigen ligase
MLGLHNRRTALIAAAISIPALVLSAAVAMRSPYFRTVIQHEAPHTNSVLPADWPASAGSFEWTVRTNFMPRISAGHAALRMAAEHPATGVGVGQYATHFHVHVPAYAMQHGEVRSWAAPDHGRMANAKNMPLRIVAETGLLGLAAWMLFISWHWRSGWRDPHWRILGATAAVAVIMDWISLDSFAFPQVWLLLALIVAARPDPASSHARG